MKIERISKIKKYRIFDDFEWPEALPNFSKYNLIYGWNGSGKTTLSNIFGYLAKKQNIDQSELTFQIDGQNIEGATLSNSAIPEVRVFNRNSIDRSMFEVPNYELSPVFYFGEDSAEKQQKVEALKSQQQLLLADKQRSQDKDASARKALDDFAKNNALVIKSLLSSSGSGAYNYYNKSDFSEKAKKLIDSSPPPYCLLPYIYNEYLEIKEGVAQKRIEPVPLVFPDYQQVVTQVSELLKRSIVSSTIATLSENPTIASWVQEGLRLHDSKDAELHCLFCTNPLQPQRIENLEGHFNEQLTAFQQEVDQQILKLQKIADGIDQIGLPNEVQFYPQLQNGFRSKLNSWSSSKYMVDVFFETLIRALREKREQPFKELDIKQYLSFAGSSDAEKSVLRAVLELVGEVAQTLGTSFGLSAITEINELIVEHNEFTKTYEKNVHRVRAILEAHTVSINLEEYNEKNTGIEDAQKEVATLDSKLSDLKSDIKKLELEMKEFVRPVEELNAEMAAYLGRDELQFQIQNSGYVISRNGHPAMNLSEGERTAIAFMYF